MKIDSLSAFIMQEFRFLLIGRVSLRAPQLAGLGHNPPFSQKSKPTLTNDGFGGSNMMRIFPNATKTYADKS
jgi:hypothetical protein